MKLINDNCLNSSDLILDGSVDLLLTDPPYNISTNGANPIWKDPVTGEDKNTIHNQKFSENFEQKWDDVSHSEFLNLMKQWSKLWFKKLRKGGSFAIFISDKYVSHLWHIMENEGFEPKRIWTWKKPAAVPFNRNVMPVSGCEYVLWGIKPGGKRTFHSNTEKHSIIDRYAVADKVSSILYKLTKDNYGTATLDTIFTEALKEAKQSIDSRKFINNIVEVVVPNTITYSGGLGKNKIHPTQKPVEILEYFIELLSNENDLILDTFAGSGSTGVASKNKNRDFILIEQDKKMFDKMSERINELVLDVSIFS